MSVLIDVHDNPRTVPTHLDGNIFSPLSRDPWRRKIDNNVDDNIDDDDDENGNRSSCQFTSLSFERFRDRRAVSLSFSDEQRHLYPQNDAGAKTAERDLQVVVVVVVVDDDDQADTLSFLKNLPSSSSSSSSCSFSSSSLSSMNIVNSVVGGMLPKANTQIKSSSPIVKEKRESTRAEERRGDTEVRVLRRLPRGLIRFY